LLSILGINVINFIISRAIITLSFRYQCKASFFAQYAEMLVVLQL